MLTQYIVRIAFLLIALVNSQGVFCQSYIATVSKDGLWGAIDQNGSWILNPKYLTLKDFNDGIALAKTETAWIFVNTKGVVISANKPYTCQHDFSEGLARVQENEKWGYIDVNGNYVITPQFDDARDFSEGLAAVKKGSYWGYIDPTGKFIIEPKLYDAKDFNCGIAIVKTGQYKEYMNTKGNVLPNPDKYEIYHDFKNGFAAVKKVELWGFINTDGVYIAKPVYEKVDDFYNGLAPVQRSGKCGYINTKGELIVDLKYTETKCFKDSMGIISIPGIIDKLFYLDIASGQVIGRDQPYDISHYFSEGLARVNKGKKWGYINKKGQLVIDYQYEDAEDFKHGLAPVKVKGLWGFIDASGSMVIQPHYDNIRSFKKLNN